MHKVTAKRLVIPLFAFSFLGTATGYTEPLSTAALVPGRLCGSLEKAPGGFGPFDYRTATSSQRHMVESHHFTTSVETLRAGHSGTLGGDIDYTLRAFPNHPRALMAMMRLADRTRTGQPTGARYLVECYFDRAIRFRPQDPSVRALYAYFLTKNDRHNEAKQQLLIGETIPNIPSDVAYNFGLAWFELGDFERSYRYAKQAYSEGIELSGLRDKLRKAGHWPN